MFKSHFLGTFVGQNGNNTGTRGRHSTQFRGQMDEAERSRSSEREEHVEHVDL